MYYFVPVAKLEFIQFIILNYLTKVSYALL